MPQAQNKDASQPGRKTGDNKDGFNPFSAFFPANFLQFHADGASAFARASETMLKTARSVWESEMELFRLEAETARNSLNVVHAGASPQALHGALEQWHRSTEKAISHIRAIDDAVRECEWQLLAISAESVTPRNGD